MSVDDALALARQVLANYEGSSLSDAPGADFLWRDQLARALRELAAATTECRGSARGQMEAQGVGRVKGSRFGRGRDGRAWTVWSRLGRVSSRIPEPGAVMLSPGEADTAWQALADAGAWHGVYGDCAACIGTGQCRERELHAVIEVQYAALRARLSSDRW